MYAVNYPGDVTQWQVMILYDMITQLKLKAVYIGGVGSNSNPLLGRSEPP